jgi:stearoyl-CoA desaturase (delta-9 desaturase)
MTKTEPPRDAKPDSQPQYRWKLIWRNIILYLIMHITGLYGLYLLVLYSQWKTIFWAWFLLVAALQGVTAGTHRLWAHKAYKAKLPLKMLLCIFQTLSLQNHIYDWATYHRVHHKYVDTDADPHNSRRGFFFSHVGWLFIEPRPNVAEKYKSIDFSDLEADPVVMIQKKYYHVFFAPVIGFLLPAVIPWYFWNESFETAFFVSTMLRYAMCTNITFLVNSWAHIFGSRPYDKNIYPTESPTVAVLTGGEGWHNYHHTFPWDYKTGEFGKYRSNLTTGFLDLMAAIGWAYDLKTASEEMIMKRVNRTGDGSRKFDKLFNPSADDHHGDDLVWGWGDKDMTQEDFSFVKIRNQKDD